MSDLGESCSINQIVLDEDPKYCFAGLQLVYPNGKPFVVKDPLQMSLAIDGQTQRGAFDLNCQATPYLLDPGTKVHFKVETEIDRELKQARDEVKQALDLIIDKEREEQTILDQTLAEEGFVSRGLILTGAFMVGVGEGALGLVEFVGDAAVLAAKASWYQAQVTLANNLEAAWETSYAKGDIQDFFNSVSAKNVADFATAFGVTPEEMANRAMEAYEIFSLVMDDPDTQSLLLQFASDYATSQAKVEYVKIAGSAAFDIILTALLAVTTGGAGNVAHAGAKIRHFGYFQKLAIQLKKIVGILNRKMGKVDIDGKLDDVIQHKVKVPPKQKLEVQKPKIDSDSNKTDNPADADGNPDSGNAQGTQKTQDKADKNSDQSDTTEQGTNKQGQSCATDSKTCVDGEPISLVTGEEMLTLVDFTFNGPMPLAWQRTYKSSNPDNQGLGFGWTHTFSEHLVIQGQRLEWHTNEARIIPFKLPAIGATARNLAEQWQVTRSREGQFVLRSTAPGPQVDKVFERELGHSQFVLSQIRDRHNNGLQLTYRDGLLCQIEARHGDLWQLEYNQQDTLAAVHKLDSDGNANTLVRYAYDQYNDLIQASDANQNSERYSYRNHLIQQRTLKSGYRFHFEWDGTDHHARCLHQYGDPIDGVATYDYRFQWDTANRRVAVTDTRGGVKQFQFNERGLPTYEKDPEGGETVTRYDELGNVIAIKNPNGHFDHFAYDEHQRLRIHTDALGHKHELSRNAEGQVTQIYDPLGQRWSRKYNDIGQLIRQSNPLGEAFQFRYNELGLVNAITNPLGQTWHYLWDHKGQLNAIRNPTGQNTRYSYNSDGAITQIVWPDGRDSQYQYDPAGNCTAIRGPDGGVQKFEYNSLGLVTKVTTAGRSSHYRYNGLSQVVRRVDPNGHILRYHYDGERNLIGLTNENGEHYQLTYDLNERLIREVGFDGRIQAYQYDAASFLTASADLSRDGQQVLNRIGFQRDPLGQLIGQYQQADGETTRLNQFEYDPLGRLVSASNPNRQLKWRYDAAGRVLEDHQNQHVLKHQYNALGQRTHSTLPDGQVLQYDFDDLGLFAGLNLNGEQLAHIQRDVLGREVERQLSNDLSTEYRYDPQGRLTAQRTGKRRPDQGFQAINLRRLHYNEQGLLSQIDDQIRGRTRYQYDHLDRLTKVAGPNPEAFIHDPAGNILASQTPEQRFEPGRVQGNRLNFHGDHHYEYDEQGNRTSVRWGKHHKQQAHYHYNALNQLAAIEQNGRVTHYQYDPLGRRIQKISATKTVDFLWHEDVLLSETVTQDGQTETSKIYLFEPGTFKPLAHIQNNQVYHYHLDHLGTPQEITNAHGKLVWAVSYRAYGNLAVAHEQAVENNLRFQGQYFDEESGLHYSRFRYYDPNCGRFINQDPIGLLGGNNGYLYVPNPTGWVDPFGLNAKSGDCPTAQPNNTWNAFQKDHKGKFGNVSDASKAYAELKQQQSPWPIDFDHTKHVRTLQPGDTFNMIVDNGSENMPGRFATFDDIPDAKYGREQLAIKEGWKPTLDNVVTYQVKKPFDVYEGPVGPQIDGSTYLPGGGSQITFKDNQAWENARPNKYNKNTNDPYLEVVSIKPVKPK